MAFGTVTGTFQGNNASIPASFAAALSTGSGVVNIGDLVVVLVTEQTALTVTSVTDSQAGSYTAQNAGTLSGANVSGRLFYRRITAAGTLTSITATCTASADDGVIVAAIINGPFLASPVDVNLANASDIVSPFTAPASGTMAQTTEVVVSWGASTGNIAWSGTAPTVIAIQQASATVVEGILGTQVPPSTATVTPTYTGTAPTADVLGTISFKGDIAAMDAAYSQPLSDPPGRIAAKVNGTKAIATMVSGLFAPPVVPILANIRWFASLSDPVRRASAIANMASGLSSPVIQPILPNIGWFAPLSDPVRKVPTPNKVNLFPFAAQASQDVSFGWFTPLSEPVRIVRAAQRPYPLAFTAAAAAETVTVDKWLVSFTDPVRTKPQLAAALQQPSTFAPNPIVPSTGWSAPLSEPARAKQRAIADYAYAPLAVSEAITVDKWFNPLAPPLRAKSGLLPSSQQVLAFAPNPIIPSFGWFNPLSESARAKSLRVFDQSPIPFATTETITVDKWLSAFSEPVRARSRFTALQAAYAIGFAPSQFNQWFAPLSEPARKVPAAQKAYPLPFSAQANPAEVITVDKWFVALSDPVRRPRIPNKVNLFPFAAQANAAEIVTVDKWFVSFTDPVRTKPRLTTALQQSLAFVKAAPFPETVTEDRWHLPWSEPVRKVPTAQKPYPLSFTAVASATEIITVDKWFTSFVDVIRRKSEERDHYKGENEWTATAVSMEWFAPLTEPVRQRKALAVANQTAFFAPSTVIPGQTITVDRWFEPFADLIRRKPEERNHFTPENEFTAIAANMKWFAPLTEPVRQKIGLSVTQQQALTFIATIPEVVTTDKWFAYLAEPVRVKPALLTARQQFLTWPPQIVVASVASWWRPLSDPPKAKTSLAAASQRFEFRTADFIPHPDRFLEGWFNWWSEPVRSKPGLVARLQPSWTGPHRVIATTVTLDMRATETGVDVATFAITVLPYNPPASAVVSLKEIGHDGSLTSIEESNVSI